MRWFVRQSIKGGRVYATNQYYRSKNCDDVLKILSDELVVKRNVYDIIEGSMKYRNELLKNVKKQYESKFDDYRVIDEEEMNNYMNEKMGEFPIYKILQEISLNDPLWVFDAVTLYPSTVVDERSIYPKIETGYAFRPDMNDDLLEKLNNQTFTQWSAFLEIK